MSVQLKAILNGSVVNLGAQLAASYQFNGIKTGTICRCALIRSAFLSKTFLCLRKCKFPVLLNED